MGMSSLITFCTRNRGGTNTLSLRKMAVCVIYFWYVLLGLPFDSRVSVMYDEMEKALKHPRIGSRPRVLNMFMTQDCCKTQPHSRVSHSLPKLLDCSFCEGWPLHQQSFLTCKYSIHEYSVFSFKFPSDWSLGGLFLTQICAFTKSIQFKQSVTALVSVLFSWQAFQNSSKLDYLLAAKPYSNLN